MPGRERERPAALEAPDRGLERLPGGVAVAAVLDVAARRTYVEANVSGMLSGASGTRGGPPGRRPRRCRATGPASFSRPRSCLVLGLPRLPRWRNGGKHGVFCAIAIGGMRDAGDRVAADGEPHKPRVAVVFGGRSSEHAVSCSTAG